MAFDGKGAKKQDGDFYFEMRLCLVLPYYFCTSPDFSAQATAFLLNLFFPSSEEIGVYRIYIVGTAQSNKTNERRRRLIRPAISWSGKVRTSKPASLARAYSLESQSVLFSLYVFVFSSC